MIDGDKAEHSLNVRQHLDDMVIDGTLSNCDEQKTTTLRDVLHACEISPLRIFRYFVRQVPFGLISHHGTTGLKDEGWGSHPISGNRDYVGARPERSNPKPDNTWEVGSIPMDRKASIPEKWKLSGRRVNSENNQGLAMANF